MGALSFNNLGQVNLRFYFVRHVIQPPIECLPPVFQPDAISAPSTTHFLPLIYHPSTTPPAMYPTPQINVPTGQNKLRFFSHPSIIPRFGALLGVALIWFSTGMIADAQKPKSPPRVTLDDSNLSKLSNALKDQCPEQFGDLTLEQRQRIVKSFKRYLGLIIEFYITQDAAPCHKEISAGLTDFSDRRNRSVSIVVDFGQKRLVKVKPDGKKEVGRDDEIRISGDVFKAFLSDFMKAANSGAKDRSLPVPPFSSPTAYQLISQLMGELLRIKHELEIPGATSHTVLRFKNHVEVIRRKIDIYKDLKMALKELRDDPFIVFVETKYKINGRVIDEVMKEVDKADELEDKEKIIDKVLRNVCEKLLDPQLNLLEREWARFKKMFGVDKGKPLDELDSTVDELIELATRPSDFDDWGSDVKKTARFVSPRGFLERQTSLTCAGGGGSYLFNGESVTIGSTDIIQVLADDSESRVLEVTGVDHVYHAHTFDAGFTLLVACGLNDSGDGVILAYSDVDADGFFDPATRTEAIRDAEIYGGAEFVQDPGTGELLLFTRDQQSLFALRYSGGAAHEFPDFLDPRGSLGFRRFDLLSAEIFADGLVAIGHGLEFEESDRDALLPYARTTAAGGEFIPVNDDYTPFVDDTRAPDFAALTLEGSEIIAGLAPPGRVITAMLRRNDLSSVIGSATANSEGELAIASGVAPQPGDFIQLVDLFAELVSAQLPVVPLNTAPSVTEARFLGTGVFVIRYLGLPGSDANLGSSTGLNNWDTEPLPPIGPFGKGSVEVSSEGGNAFFRITQPDP